ncbi:hypothetical protein AB3X34_04515 [Raoultella terrigena]|uniref:hypothetical protein n=1 Tax=Raoultella terrigena TaxID=577 RepID=UPI00349F3630
MTDITELAQRNELLIANGQQTADLLRHLADNEIDSDYFAVVSECERYGKETDAELSITEFALRAAGYVDALVEALEKAQSERDELRLGFIANQEEAHEAIKYATELKEQLSRACAGREEAFREVDEMQKSLDHTHRRRAIWREKAVTAETEIAALRQRIAELEAKPVQPCEHSMFWDASGVKRCSKCDMPEHANVHYADAAEMEIAALRQRIAELESRTVTVKLPRPGFITISGERVAVYMKGEVVAALLAAGIK